MPMSFVGFDHLLLRSWARLRHMMCDQVVLFAMLANIDVATTLGLVELISNVGPSWAAPCSKVTCDSTVGPWLGIVTRVED